MELMTKEQIIADLMAAIEMLNWNNSAGWICAENLISNLHPHIYFQKCAAVEVKNVES